MHMNSNLSSLLCSLQLLLDLLKRGVLAMGHGGIQLGYAVKRRGLREHLESLARCSLVQLDDLYVFDLAPVEIHRICEKSRVI